jgi:1,2-dihydroxy-3-keto-5-methylthiopentene dioxygenase
MQLCEDLNYSYADIITVTAIVESFWEEHHQEHETICWALGGAGYFDIHDVNDEWVRLHMKKGDFFTWPAGINHRFSVDLNSSMQAMHLFKGSPIWTAYPRDEVFGNHTARNDYVDTYLCGKDPDLAAADDGSMDTSSAISMFGIVSKIALTLSLAISSLVRVFNHGFMLHLFLHVRKLPVFSFL